MSDEDRNPYAPPAAADEPPPFVPPTTSRGLRISGGVVMLLVGLWSAAGGSCTMLAGHALDEYSEEFVRALPDSGTTGETRQALQKLAASAPALVASGSVIFASGLLCLIAAGLFFFDRGRAIGLVAASLGVVGEGLYLATVALNVAAAVKIACLGFGAFCALRVGHPRPAAGPAPPRERGSPP